MKVFEKIGKVFVLIFIFLKGITAKVYATYIELKIQPEYGVMEPVKETTAFLKVWDIIKKLYFIPIALLVGIIMYLIKSKASVKKKIFVIFVLICIMALIMIFFRK